NRLFCDLTEPILYSRATLKPRNIESLKHVLAVDTPSASHATLPAIEKGRFVKSLAILHFHYQPSDDHCNAISEILFVSRFTLERLILELAVPRSNLESIGQPLIDVFTAVSQHAVG
ncbi:hypothetical protein FRB94_011388, partial [Tulasnella sp. JGI-2019a]